MTNNQLFTGDGCRSLSACNLISSSFRARRLVLSLSVVSLFVHSYNPQYGPKDSSGRVPGNVIVRHQRSGANLLQKSNFLAGARSSFFFFLSFEQTSAPEKRLSFLSVSLNSLVER